MSLVPHLGLGLASLNVPLPLVTPPPVLPANIAATDPSNPISCLDVNISPTLARLITCLTNYTVPEGFYNETTYQAAQPTDSQRSAWLDVVTNLLDLSGRGSSDPTNPCASVVTPSPLKDIYTISPFTDNGTSIPYCVLAESHSKNSSYVKGWGVFVVPAAPSGVQRYLHISAPHPWFDGDTPTQAATVFGAVGAKSLLIDGRIRTAYLAGTGCVEGGNGYYRTDPAHNKLELFYDTNRAIWAWQEQNGGCPAANCAFIQFHGKAATTCPTDAIFLSTGLARSASSVAWYTDSTPRPVKSLQSRLRANFPTWNVSLPSDSDCTLTATQNVVGRWLNGIDDANVCTQGSTASLAQGVFVHAEQSATARGSGAYAGWIKAVNEAFQVIH